MNSMPDMTPAIPQTPMSDSSFQDKSSPDKSEFASLVEKECSKSTHCKSDQKEIKSDSVMKEADGLSGLTSASNDCSTDINNTIHNTSGNKVQQNTDDIKPVNEDEAHTDDEADPVKGIKPGALLFSLVQSYRAEIKNTSQVSTGDGTTESSDIEAGGPGSESESENGLKVSALLNNLITNYVSEIEGEVNLDPGSVQSTGLSGVESSDLPAGNGLKVGTLLNNLVSEPAAEIKVVPVPNSENNQGAELKGTESGEAGTVLQTENGLKAGDLLSKLIDRPVAKESGNGTVAEDVHLDKGQPAEEDMKLNAKSDPAETADLTLKKEIPVEGEIASKASIHTEKNHADDKTVVMDSPKANDNSEGLNGRTISGSSDQFKHENGTGDRAFNFAKGPHNSGNDVETNNINLINTSNATVENAKSIQSPSAFHTAKTPGVQELLDNVVYVIKGNSKMGISIENESLGKLNISLSLEKGLVNVHINTPDKLVRELLENNIQQIVDTLNKDGVSVGEFSVGLKDQREHEMNRFSLKNGQGREIPLETKKENRHSGLVNIFA